MSKTPRINVLTVRLTVHIPVDPGDIDSVQEVARHAESLRAVASELGQTSVETRLSREPAPAPAPVADQLDIPDAPDAVAAE